MIELYRELRARMELTKPLRTLCEIQKTISLKLKKGIGFHIETTQLNYMKLNEVAYEMS